jgi:4'-phosphopantetheinyl transferase
LGLSQSDVAALHDLLDKSECERAERFVFDRDRDRFVISHARLRQILATYANVSPKSLQFGTGPYGKPYLTWPALSPRSEFNMSHSGDVALYAVALGQSVGIDLENMRRELDYQNVIQSVFSEYEREALASLPLEQRRAGFYAVWTRKEAFIKAIGHGLSYPLSSFSVSVHPGEPTKLYLPEDLTGERWTLQTLHPGDGYIAALAVAGNVAQIRLYEQNRSPAHLTA